MAEENRGEETFLSESAGWKEEAEAVINDVKEHVKSIRISEKLECSDSNIYINVTTVEGKELTVELSCQGFYIVSLDGHDIVSKSVERNDSDYFETPYSLLDSISPGYKESFGNSLAEKLAKLAGNSEEK